VITVNFHELHVESVTIFAKTSTLLNKCTVNYSYWTPTIRKVVKFRQLRSIRILASCQVLHSFSVETQP